MRSVLYLLCFLLFSCIKPTRSQLPVDDFAKGADVSWITEMEQQGVLFYSEKGKQMEGMALMKSLGMNTIRLRIWVNPAEKWNGRADVIAKALRARELGMRIMLNFHYSDNWADPGKQYKPTAWAALPFSGLKQALAQYTLEVLREFRAAGIDPEWVQVGNETDDGLLWPDGKASQSMAAYAALIDAGYGAVKEVFPTAKVIAHVSNGWNNELFRWNIGGLIANGARFDVIGLSLYPTAANWRALTKQCMDNVQDMVTRYGKETMIVEVGMPWDQPDAAHAFLSELILRARAIENEKCSGVLYWEPQAHNNWKGYTLGAFNTQGRPTKALQAFAH